MDFTDPLGTSSLLSSSQMSLTDVVEYVINEDVAVERIDIVGCAKTNPAVIRAAAAAVFANDAKEGIPFSDLVHRLSKSVEALQGTRNYSSIVTNISPGSDASHAIIEYQVGEKRLPYTIDGNMELGTAGSEASASGTWHNLFGGAEDATLTYSYGGTGVHAYTVGLSKPFVLDVDKWGHNTANIEWRHRKDDHQLQSSYQEAVTGLEATLEVHPQTRVEWTNSHTFGYRLQNRNVIAGSRTASLAVREDAKQTVKSSIFHRFILPFSSLVDIDADEGSIDIETELAGLGGDARFFRSEVLASHTIEWSDRLETVFSARLGMLTPWGGDRTRINDRLQFNMRGWRTNTLGPQAQRAGAVEEGGHPSHDSIGGTLFAGATIAARLSPAYPLFEDLGAKLQVFGNVGNNILIGKKGSIIREGAGLLHGYRAGVGAGVVLPISSGELELNFCYPLAHRPHDKLKGFQVRFGIHLV